MENFIPPNPPWVFLLRWGDNSISKGLSQAFAHRSKEWSGSVKILDALVTLDRPRPGSKWKWKSWWPVMSYIVAQVKGRRDFEEESGKAMRMLHGWEEGWRFGICCEYWTLGRENISRESLWKFSQFCEWILRTSITKFLPFFK